MKAYIYNTSLGIALLSLIAGALILVGRVYVYFANDYTFDFVYFLTTLVIFSGFYVSYLLGKNISVFLQRFSDLPPPVPKQKTRIKFSAKYK